MDPVTAAKAYFSKDYAEARRRFLDLCGESGVEVRNYLNPNRGPSGEVLATDTAWFGPRDAGKVMVQVSATHGAEGFPGSAAQCDWIANQGTASLPEDVACLVVHAINPHGFAWLRRVTEEGVDLNRNFVDFDAPLPENPGYEELADVLVPQSLDAETLAESDRRIEAYRERHGDEQLMIARSGGQYNYAGGMFYGGRAPTWSRQTLETLAADYELPARELVGVVDFHTGLGPFGYGEPICGHAPDSINVKRAKRWYGQSVTEPALGTSSSVEKTGLAEFGWHGLLGDAVTMVALEYGTYPPGNGLRVLRADHWLHNTHNTVDWQAPVTKEIKQAIRGHFSPDSIDWQEMIVFRARQILRQGFAGLAGRPELEAIV
jgi:hypothetical protein